MHSNPLSTIDLLVLDVDGVLTDGTIELSGNGTETKRFHLQDGHGIKLWQRTGGIVALISGRASAPTQRRAEQLEIEYVFEDCLQKLPVLKQLAADLKRQPEQIAYIGDDLLDLPPVRWAGFGIAVANAVNELKAQADYVTRRSGGAGAVREAVEIILKGSGRWANVMQRYHA